VGRGGLEEGEWGGVVLSAFGTVALLFALLLTLLLLTSTSCFTARPLTGPDTMAYASVLLALVGAACCLARGAFDWVSSEPGVPALVVVLGHAGLGVVAVAAWIQSTVPRRWYRVPVANLGAAGLPAVVQAYLLAGLWADPAAMQAAGWPRAVGYPLAGVGLIGLAAGGALLVI